MYVFKLKLSEKARGYCMYVFLVINRTRKLTMSRSMGLFLSQMQCRV